MQDGAASHRSHESHDIIEKHFHHTVIRLIFESRCKRDVQWHMFTVLNTCDYFFCGYLNNKCYRNAPSNPYELEEAIQVVQENIPPAASLDVIIGFKKGSKRF